MKAEIITIGDEILIGQIIDTNSQWIGQELNKIGVSTYIILKGKVLTFRVL
jgi:nicotinamide-nucleotide amidase